MSESLKRPALPGAAELFRPTNSAEQQRKQPPRPRTRTKVKNDEAVASGRVRHDEKITVYFSSDELIRLEDARLDLRRQHRVAVDRGRIVRAAVALALADLAEHGEESVLYRHLEK